MPIKNGLATETSGISTSIGLLVLRTCIGISLFLKHGLEKLTGYSIMVQHFPDPIHIGAHASLAFALLSDGVCSLLVVLGLGTRPAAAVICVNLLTAFFFVHHAALFSNGHVELVWVYVTVFASLLITGAGRLSVDAHLSRGTKSRPV
jgi:putative oxidoreductase